MKILNKLTNEYLKQNKKRTIVTIIGIILSGAMITAVATLAVSFQNFMIKVEKEATGSWEAILQNIPYSQVKYIENHENIKQTMHMTDLGKADNLFSEEPYIDVRAYDKEALDNVAFGIEEGNLPTNNKEIILSNTFYDKKGGEPRVGDTITLSLKGKERTYVICGIMSRPSFEEYNSDFVGAVTLLTPEELTKDTIVDVGIITKKPKDIYEDCEQIAETINEEAQKQVVKIKYNGNVLAYMGVNKDAGFNAMIYSVCGLLILVIAIGSILVIYNSFAISVSERKKQFGMLSSVGATKKQLKKSVTHEAIVLASIGIPIGILSGMGGIWVTLKVVNLLLSDMTEAIGSAATIDFATSWQAILISAVLIAITIYISAYIPAKRASKIAPIEAIRQNDDVKVKAKKVKTPKWIRKVFGEEGEIALKNLKRSKKRYRTTVISLIISIVLFMTVNGFISYMFKGFSSLYQTVDYDYIASYRSDTSTMEEMKEIGTKLGKTEGISKYASYIQTYGWATIPKNKLTKECYHFITTDENYQGVFEEKNGGYDFTIEIYNSEEQEMKAYLKSLGVDSLEKNEIVLVNYTNMLATEKVEMNLTDYKEGDTLSISYPSEGENITEDYTIRAVTDKMPYGLENQNVSLFVIVNWETVQALQKEERVVTNNFYYTFVAKTENGKALDEKITQLKKEDMTLDMIGQDVKQLYQANRNLVLIISIFLYGFIILISLIGIANIFNTIATNISLRRREFANLKSIGMTDKQFKRMLDLECIFYGTKALLFGIPLGTLLCYLLNMSFDNMVSFDFIFPWSSILISIVAVYTIVFITMQYASKKVKKENIMDVLRDDNV